MEHETTKRARERTLESFRVLPVSFFARTTSEVARDLLGKCLLVQRNKKLLVARIVETEAYLGTDDPASHAARGPTPRSAIMFGHPGVIYVYFIYGNYFMLNFVTESHGVAGAVLIRALEPVFGIEEMQKLRPVSKVKDLTNGPAKLALALGITSKLNGKELGLPHLAVAEDLTCADLENKKKNKVCMSSRIGISVGKELQLRFFEEGNPFVSKG